VNPPAAGKVKTMAKVYSHTLALCPTCKEKVRARLIRQDDNVYLEKFCPGHGTSRVLAASDVEWYEASLHYVKPGQEPVKRNVDTFDGCPASCGLCPQHQQHTCLPVIEITNRCQLDCPVCLKKFNRSFELTADEFAGIIDNLLATEGKVDVINISGGEPTLHPRFETLVDMALDKGVAQVSVSTNGLQLLQDKKTREVFKRTQAIAALQFDGFSPAVGLFLRGTDLSGQKMELIKILEAEGIHYSLVATAAKGINDNEIAEITDFFFQSGAITLMFQPIAFTGNAARLEVDKYRLSIPCVVRELERSRYVKKGDFNPLPCSHFSCFALSYYLQVEDGEFLSLKSFLGEEIFLNICANKTLPGLDGEGFGIIRDRLNDLWSAADSGSLDEKVLLRIKNILRTMQVGNLTNRQKIMLGAEHMKAIFIHHFMDIHTMDLGRLVKCCNPYPRAGDRLIPMCAENVFFSK
jgi:uncharacterized radical SAM superfamily Fe-S cluster-containing enzyme